MITYETGSEEETFHLGRRMAERLRPGTVIVLVGDLGAGKTVFVKGVAAGAGIPDPASVTSPTFVLMNTYEGRWPIRHYDLYRLEDGREIESLGFCDYRGESVVLIEWGDRVPASLLGPHFRVEFEVSGERRRTIRFRGIGIPEDFLNLAVPRSV